MRGTPSLANGLASTLRCCVFIGVARSEELFQAESVQLLQHKPMRESAVGPEGLDQEMNPYLEPGSNYLVVESRPVPPVSLAANLAEGTRLEASNLLEQAEELFLSSNINPDEKAFATESMQAIAESLLPAIFDEHRLDVDLLQKEWQSFGYATLELESGAAELDSQREYRDAESVAHRTCRRGAAGLP